MERSHISETETEWMFKDLLDKNGYTSSNNVIIEFKNKTKNEKIKKLLKNASKSGRKNGIPDFIIRSHDYPDIIFLIECKADIKYHESTTRKNYANYAVDGVLLYSSFISKEFDVISIAISGNKSRYKVSAFWQLKETDVATKIDEDKFLLYEDYIRIITKSDDAFRRDYNSLLEYAKNLNENLHKKKIKESYRALLISGILVALQNQPFRETYHKHKNANELITILLATISTQLRSDSRKDKNADAVFGSFTFIRSNRTFTDSQKGLSNLVSIINSIKENVYNFLDKYKYIDTLSQFYVEFLRYANNDKGLGIVLTPIHITQLFAKMSGVNKNTSVLDNAAGTGGFLVAAMGEMIKDAGDDSKKISDIKAKQIYGIEYEDSILSLLISNMIIHSDGRSNITWGSTFDVIPNNFLHLKRISSIENGHEIKSQTSMYSKNNLTSSEFIDLNKNIIDIGILNPPFKMAKDDVDEFDFIFSNLSAVKKKGIVIALVPASVVIDVTGNNYRNKSLLLKNHTLEAVVSLPEDLFANSKTSVVTVGIVITAHMPHPTIKKTWFGYWRNDNFVKTKNLGRADIHHTWSSENGIENRWLSDFINRDTSNPLNIKRKITAEDEWVAEAYINTPYKELSDSDILKPFYQHMAFKIENGYSNKIDDYSDKILILHRAINLSNTKNLDEIFYILNGTPSSLVEIEDTKISDEFVPYIRPSKKQSSSYAGFINYKSLVKRKILNLDKIYPENTLYVSTDGAGSHTFSYVSIESFIPNSNVSVLIPKEEMTVEEKLLYAAYITANRFKFSYGRKPKGKRLASLKVPYFNK